MWNSSEEEYLLKEVKASNYQAFEQLYTHYFDVLYVSAFNLLRDHQAAEDIVQDIFSWFWENRTRWNLTSCKGYLLAAIRFKVASYFRSNTLKGSVYANIERARPVLLDESVLLEVKQLREIIDQVIDDLPTRCQEIFRLSRFSNFTNKEIAAQLNISEKTVEAQITIALKRIRGHLRKFHYLLLLLM